MAGQQSHRAASRLCVAVGGRGASRHPCRVGAGAKRMRRGGRAEKASRGEPWRAAAFASSEMDPGSDSSDSDGAPLSRFLAQADASAARKRS